MTKVCVHGCTELVEEYIIAAINQYDTMSKSDWFSFCPLNPLHNLNMAVWSMNLSTCKLLKTTLIQNHDLFK